MVDKICIADLLEINNRDNEIRGQFIFKSNKKGNNKN